MGETVSVRDLRNNSAEVLARVTHGESLIVTRDGAPVAQVVPLPRRRLSTAEILRRFEALPPVDHATMRAEIDQLITPELPADEDLG
ncbi:type II toxin-antitoxin system Phd/YefM family antitoxin [Microbacterium sp.]|uniref:type II toxin-antitoxin system Phd/YefM family antitoxin n=1 Tax=Microbacterium sp. TaxID=51671 RepID=UPI0039E5B989